MLGLMFRLLALDQDIMQDVTQTQDSFENIILVDDCQPVYPTLPNGIKYGVQSII